jgi:type II secretory pathway pseudopilin PulG
MSPGNAPTVGRHGQGARRRPSQDRGVALLLLLVAVALISVGLMVVGPTWAAAHQRDREQELKTIGRLYAQALQAYKDSSPGTAKTYPQTLEQLLEDTRYVGTKRYLRKLYPDPMAPGKPWTPIRADDGRIIGVRSTSELAPMSDAQPTDAIRAARAPVRSYADWHFLADLVAEPQGPKP